MKVALIADTFPPLRTSGAVQIRDLSREFVRQGHKMTVIVPSPDQDADWSVECVDGVDVLRLKAPRIKDMGYLRRSMNEFAMPFVMLFQFRKSPLYNELWDGVIWYSPSIFHGPLVSFLKRRSRCKGYLIIRDIFPEWAVDMGLMGRGLTYRFFDAIARYQYAIADVIGVQTSGNLNYFERWSKQPNNKLEVLHNWLDNPEAFRSSIRIDETVLAGRKVFIYAGNMGVAQGMDVLLELAEKMRCRTDVGFLFVGRGSEVSRLKAITKKLKLDNVLFYDEIPPDEIYDLYSQCSAGIVTLDPRHKSHNIPGKFITYMRSGLPVLATINQGNDLAKMIQSEKVGQVCESNQVNELTKLAEKLLCQIDNNSEVLNASCTSLFKRKFSVEEKVIQIVSALEA